MLDREIEKLNKMVEDFIQLFNEDYTARFAADFCACLDENVVEWSILYAEHDGETFYNDFCRRYPCAKKLDLFFLALLHEIGHLETEDEMIDDTFINVNGLEPQEYYELYNEKLATDWAGWWITENFEWACAENNNFNKALKEFFKTTLNMEF